MDTLPPKEIREFFIATLPKIGLNDELESSELAAALIRNYSGKRKFGAIDIAKHFSCIAELNLIHYEQRWTNKGGMRFFLCRTATASKIEEILGEKKPKKKKRCCASPRPVKSKKTGKRRCKNCNTALPDKKRKKAV